MSNNIKYSIEQDTDSGSIFVRSTVKSFNLDHVTDKDIVSFYRNFSSAALFDTGIMPVNGSGVLSIRSAGNHTQIAYQHEPSINHINWGQHEGDSSARTFTVAQPYRIWIADLLNGNFYGARMFYSIYPITSPDNVLYHVNLPNTNCKGYRGNGVGWQCLYHRDDWTNIPFNEKIALIAERCSGVETYNDANMSETDGPRFYKDHYLKDHPELEFLWNPTKWQQKTDSEGLNWVYDSNLWIPIKVNGIDDQGSHSDSSSAEPLTLRMALLGNYGAYYNDTLIPKPVNSFARKELSVSSDTIFSWLKVCYNNSKIEDSNVDVMSSSMKLRSDLVDNPLNKPTITNEEDESDSEYYTIVCPISGDACEMHENDEVFHDNDGSAYCESCFSDNVAYCENTEEYIQNTNDDVTYIDFNSIYVNNKVGYILECSSCSNTHYADEKNQFTHLSFHEDGSTVICHNCIKTWIVAPEDSTQFIECYNCASVVANGGSWSSNSVLINAVVRNPEYDTTIFNDGDFLPLDLYVKKQIGICPSCSKWRKFCPSGHYTHDQIIAFAVPFYVDVKDIDGSQIKTQLNGLCSACCSHGVKINKENPEELAKFSDPFKTDYQRRMFTTSVLSNIAFYDITCFNLTNPEAPF